MGKLKHFEQLQAELVLPTAEYYKYSISKLLIVSHTEEQSSGALGYITHLTIYSILLFYNLPRRNRW